MKKDFFQPNNYFQSCLIAMGVAVLVSCGKSAPSSDSQKMDTLASEQVPSTKSGDQQPVDTTMKAPQILTDRAGLISLQSCPNSYKSLSVSVSEDLTEAKIFSDGKLMQTISDSDGGLVAAGGDIPVAYMDANFDGYVDIFIGPGESRTYSTLLLWNPETRQFDRTGELGSPAFQNIMLHPSGKSVYEGGSMSAFCDCFFRYVWDDGQLKDVEELTIVYDPALFEEYEVENVYTLKDADKQPILSTDDANQLPGVWKYVSVKGRPVD